MLKQNTVQKRAGDVDLSLYTGHGQCNGTLLSVATHRSGESNATFSNSGDVCEEEYR